MWQEHMGLYYLALGVFVSHRWRETCLTAAPVSSCTCTYTFKVFLSLNLRSLVDVRQLCFNHKAVVLICLCSVRSLQAAQKQAKNRKKVCCRSASASVVPSVLRHERSWALTASWLLMALVFHCCYSSTCYFCFCAFVVARLHRTLTEKLPPLLKLICLCPCRGSKSWMPTHR